MKIFLWAGRAFEPWDWRNPESPGIGGSETCQVEMARRLAARGHDVTSYAPIRSDTTDDGPVKWRDYKEADFNQPGTWFIFRSPETADRFEPSEDRKFIHISQDVSYFEGCGGAYTPERAAKFESIVGLCEVHCDFLRTQYPFMADKVVQSSNGICSDRIEHVARQCWDVDVDCRGHWDGKQTQRNPHKLVWSSSPDRGLEALLLILQRALEFEPQLKLHVFYGFDNWDKVISSHYLKSPGVGYRDARWPESVPSQTVFDVMNLHAPYCIENGVAKRQTRYGEPVESKPRCPQESMKWRILELAAACGDAVVWGGRIGQSRLWRELLTAGLWVYPTTFQETSPVHGDTLVETLSGPKKIKDLAGKSGFHVWSCNQSGDLSFSKVKWCGQTRANAKVITITVAPGTGRNEKKAKRLTLTPDHEVMLANGQYIPAGRLRLGDRVKAFHKRPNGWGKGYAAVGLTDRTLQPAHRMVAAKYAERDLFAGEVVDHLNQDTTNNEPTNLLIRLSQADHASRHYRDMDTNEKKRRAELFVDSTGPSDKSAARQKMWDKLDLLSEKERAEFCKRRAAKRDNVAAGITVAKIMKSRFGDNPWWDRDQLHRAYIIEQKSTVQIGEEWGCSDNTIHVWLKRHGIRIRTLSESQLVRKNQSNHTIISIQDAGYADVFCMEVESDHNFVANGVVVHNCISSMESQACGAIPITSPIWATGQNVKFGSFIEGDPIGEPLVRARYIAEMVEWIRNPDEDMRASMMRWAREKFNWERIVDQWESWCVESPVEAELCSA